MFDLNESIKLWRTSLEVRPEIIETDMDELEDHLREEFDALKLLGLLNDEAFLISTRRLGTAKDLSDEFALADPKRRRNFRLSWMVSGALTLVFLWLAVEVVTNFSTGFFGSIQGINRFSRGVVGLGWIAGLFRITILGFGGMIAWRLLSTDRTSHRLSNLSGRTVLIFSPLLVMLAIAARVASKAFMARMLVKDDFMDVALTSAYINLTIMFVLPVVLLVGLWRLSKV